MISIAAEYDSDHSSDYPTDTLKSVIKREALTGLKTVTNIIIANNANHEKEKKPKLPL